MKSPFDSKYLLEPRRNIALEASAGTGKTYILTLRLFNILLKQVEARPINSSEEKIDSRFIQEVVALTFTNKAAHEMKERLLKWIRVAMQADKLTSPDEGEYTLLFELEPNINLLKHKAQRLYILLLNSLSRLEISTLDSFLLGVIRLFPFELGIRPDIEVADEAKEELMFEEALDLTLIEAVHNEGLKNDLLELSRQDLLRRGIREWIKAVFRGFIAHKEFVKDFVFPSIKDLKEAEQRVWQAAKDFVKQTKNILKNKSGLKTLDKIEKSNSIKELACIPLFSKPSLAEHQHFKSVASACEEGFQTLKQALSGYLFLSNQHLVGVLYELFKHFDTHFETIKRRENCLTFADLSSLAYRLLVKQNFYSDQKDFFYYRLDARIKHLLLDEFQDTNVLQWQILEPLVNELVAGIGSRDTAGSFFFVGDPKQAIYRFRGGESRLSEYVKSRFKGFIEEKTLPINYRSSSGLVTFVNKVGFYLKDRFGFPFQEQQSAFSNEAGKKQPHFIRFDLLPPEEASLELKQANGILGKTICGIIEELKALGFDYKDIGILVRRKKTAERFLSILKEAGIPVQTETQVLLMMAPSVRAVVNLLGYLDNPKNKLGLSVFLKALGLSDPQIEDFFVSKQAYEGLKKRLESLRNQVDLVSICSLLKRIYDTFDLPSKLGDRPNLVQLMEVAHQFEMSSLRSLRAFLNYLEERKGSLRQAKETLEGSVKVITVHKAKGLEYEAVILPDTNYDCTDETQDRLIWEYSYQNSGFMLEGIYLRPNRCEAELNPRLKKAKEYAQKRHLEDELNLLYVALTRAKKALFILSQVQRKALPQICWTRLIASALDLEEVLEERLKDIACASHPFTLYQEGTLPRLQESNKKSFPKTNQGKVPHIIPTSSLVLPFRLTSEQDLEGLLPEPISPAGEEKFGEAFHEVMAHIKTYNDNLDYALLKAKEKFGLYLKETDWKEIKERSQMVLEALREFFCPGLKVFNEVSFISGAKSYRADRIIIDKKLVRILDYKTGSYHPDHKKQLLKYQDILKKIYPDKALKAYLVYVLTRGVEIVEVHNNC